MAEASTLETLSPKELGKHLREVRRRKGLSLSEVARGAGLTRRELNAYEKGKSPIPDSDLFVLAGSCGVDVAELRVPTTAAELGAAHEVGNALVPANGPQPVASTIGDVVAQLRRGQEVVPPPVPAESRRRRRPRAIATAPEPVVEATPAPWPDQVDSYEAVDWPDDASIPSPSASETRGPAEPVDVFEELARLPDPEPLPASTTAGPDFFGRMADPETPPFVTDDAPAAPPFVEWPAFEADNDADADALTFDESDGEPVLVEMPQDAGPDLTTAADAPPINVEMRGESSISPWDALRGSDPLSTVDASESAFETHDDWSYAPPSQAAAETLDDADIWEPANIAASANRQWFEEVSSPATPDTDPSAFDMGVDDDWIPEAPESVDTNDSPSDETFLASETVEAVDTAPEASVSHIFDPRFAGAPAESAPGSWAHEPDPNATSTGFYIDWGDSDDAEAEAEAEASDVTASVWDLPEAVVEWETPPEPEFETEIEPETATAPIVGPWTIDAESQVVEAGSDYGTHPVYQAPYDYDADVEYEAASEPETDGAQVIEAFGPIAAEPIDVFVPYQHEPYEPEPTEAFTEPEPFESTEPEPTDVFVPYQHEPYEAEPTEAFTAPEPVDLFEPAAPAEPFESPEPEPTDVFVPFQHESYEPEPEPADALATPEPVDVFEPAAPAEPFEIEPSESDFVIEGDDEPPLISWHPQLDIALDAPIEPLAPVAEQVLGELIRNQPPFVVHTPNPSQSPSQTRSPRRRHEESFVVAGAEWVLGNAVPLVEVRSTGSLVMRRADERWALADVIASPNFAVEVNVDLRSGPGFGVLFCADLDDQGQMSGYSFDVDPVYEGGGYLVREWRANRELWNPIGHVAAPHLAGMSGLLEVRLTVDEDRLVAAVNGEVVLTIDSLQQASIDRGRDGASGNRVGVQAWSSTDLVIDELRIATR